MSERIHRLINESLALINDGMIEDALRTSGEALALADSALSQSPSHDTAVTMLIAADCHVRQLMQAGMACEAFSCAMMALVSIDIVSPAPDRRECTLTAMLLETAMMAVMHAVDSLRPTPENQASAISLLSRLGTLYKAFAAQSDDLPNRHNIMALVDSLQQHTDQAQTPTPTEVHKSTYAEILNSASQLGILEL